MCRIRTTLANRAFSSLPWEGSGLLAAWDALWARLGAARPRLLGFRQCILTNPVQYLGFVRSMRIDETEIEISAMGRPRDDLCLAVPLLEPRLVPKPARAEASRREYRHSNGSEAEPLPVLICKLGNSAMHAVAHHRPAFLVARCRRLADPRRDVGNVRLSVDVVEPNRPKR